MDYRKMSLKELHDYNEEVDDFYAMSMSKAIDRVIQGIKTITEHQEEGKLSREELRKLNDHLVIPAVKALVPVKEPILKLMEGDGKDEKYVQVSKLFKKLFAMVEVLEM